MKTRAIICLFVVLVVAAGSRGFQAGCFAETLQPGAEPDVADLLPADTLAYARMVNIQEVVPARILSPAFNNVTIVQLIQGLQEDVGGEFARIGFSQQGLGELFKTVRTVHLAIVGINYDEETPSFLGVLELSDPKIAARVLADYARRAAERGLGPDEDQLTWVFRGTTVYRIEGPIYVAVKGHRLFFAFDPVELKMMLLGKKADPALADVAAYEQLRKRYGSRECFIFGNAKQAFRLLRQSMDSHDLEELNTVDNALGLSDIRAIGIGSHVEVDPNKATTEVTILLDESNPMRAAFRGVPLDPAQHFKMLPNGCFFGLFANFEDPKATWLRVKKILRQTDDGFDNMMRETKKGGLDFDELVKPLAGPVGMFYVPQKRRDLSCAVAMSVRDHNELKSFLQRMAGANPKAKREEIGKFEGLTTRLASVMIGPGYVLLGSDDMLAIRMAIAALEVEADRDTAVIRAISAIGGGTATKAFFFNPMPMRETREFRKLAPATDTGFRWVLTTHEEKDAIHLRTNISVYTILVALLLMS